MRPQLDIDADIRSARMPPAALYRDPLWQQALESRVLARTWHLLATTALPPGHSRSSLLLPGALDQSLLETRDEAGHHHLLDNSCTHRGHLLSTDASPTPTRTIRCRYHGRRFSLDGRCLGSPGFDDLTGMDLPRPQSRATGPLTFAALDPTLPFDDWIQPLRMLTDPAAPGSPLAADDRAHIVDCHWALYVDNYLEGLHIPFVHPGLASQVGADDYQVDLLPHGVLQLGQPRHPDAPTVRLGDGRQVAAAWLWLYPCTMFNLYPWGLSINVVQPAGPGRCRVLYRSFLTRPELRQAGAGGDLDQVEGEDQAVVSAVQRGLASQLWRPGRYAPQAERGVHHFHRLLAGQLAL